MHGFCHIEIPTTDPQRSKKFYSEVFDWQMNESMPDYIMFSTPDDEGGGFTTTKKPTADGVVLYIEVENIDKKLVEIEQAGGRTVKGKAGISEEFGFYAQFTDPVGNIMGLWSRRG
jgi:predicted enzyme related to lactoylglutathione lyase